MYSYGEYIKYAKYQINYIDECINYNRNILKSNEHFNYNENSSIKFNFSIDYNYSEVKYNELDEYKLNSEHIDNLDKYNNSELLNLYAIVQIDKTQICINHEYKLGYYNGELLMIHSGNIVSNTKICKESSYKKYFNINKFSQTMTFNIFKLLTLSNTVPIAIFIYGSKYVDNTENTSNLPITITNSVNKNHILSLHNNIESNSTGLLALLTFNQGKTKITKVDYYEKGNYDRPSKIHQIIKTKYWDNLKKIEPLLESLPIPYSIMYNDYYEDIDNCNKDDN